MLTTTFAEDQLNSIDAVPTAAMILSLHLVIDAPINDQAFLNISLAIFDNWVKDGTIQSKSNV